ncbi:uncharacterized protein LOC105178735 [Sesamum indicum]|uniref:Uncharacterized protein LOC105178735 n=1 Tax=Sesamum indicum TaxID=4182 RepID=A0A6I9UGG4_SESIN|nr:uncharacterized protein LOC105178735 [Sesamum indicum]
MNPSDKLYYLKKLTQILLPISLFSLLFSHESSLPPMMLQSYDYLVSSLSTNFFTYTSERNYVFLLCNGILALIIGTSFESGSKGIRFRDRHPERVNEFQEKTKSIEVVVKLAEEAEGREENGPSSSPIAEVDKYVELNCQNCDEIEEDEEEDGVDDDQGCLSEDEMNKKFDDFIKRMKQEFHGVRNNSIIQ